MALTNQSVKCGIIARNFTRSYRGKRIQTTLRKRLLGRNGRNYDHQSNEQGCCCRRLRGKTTATKNLAETEQKDTEADDRIGELSEFGAQRGVDNFRNSFGRLRGVAVRATAGHEDAGGVTAV